jgi:hypothetical protein
MFRFLHQRKQAKMQWIQDPSQNNVDNLNNVRRDASRHFSQLLNIHGVNDVRQTEIQTAEPLVPDPSAFEFQMATEKLKRHKPPGIDQIPAAVITAGGRKFRSEINKLIHSFGIMGNCMRSGKNRLLLPTVIR